MIIAAYAGVGKTTFAKLYPDHAIDFTMGKYKYLPNKDYCQDENNEAMKANHFSERNFEYPRNYFNAIMEALEQNPNKYIIIPSDCGTLDYFEDYDIPYTLCYPRREAKEEYRKRYIERGNNERFLEIFIGRWAWYMELLHNEFSFPSAKRIVLEAHQFLSDVIPIRQGG